MIHVFKDSRYVILIFTIYYCSDFKFIINFIHLILIQNFCQFNLHGKKLLFLFQKIAIKIKTNKIRIYFSKLKLD